MTALSLLLVTTLLAADAPAPPVLTKAPALLRFVEAPYPDDALADHAEGAVTLEVDLSDTGAVTGVRLVAPSGRASFDAAALAAVQQFAFSPAELDGSPAPVTITYVYRFTYRPPPVVEAPKEAPPAAVTLRGVVIARGTKKPVVGATVDVGAGAFVATTDATGSFALQGVPPGRHAVVIEGEGFLRFTTEEEVVAGEATQVRYHLRRTAKSDYHVEVRGERDKKEVARVTLTAEEIRAVPGTNGDTIRVVQNLPGVARAPFGFGVLLVRGGAPQDTRGYIDGQWVPVVFHFGGLRSVYPSELVEDVRFYAGNFGVRYGRAIGGAVEVVTRDPDEARWHLVADASLIDAMALVEGPVTDELAIAASVRRSYVDAVLVTVLPSDVGVSFVLAPRYWDFQLKSRWEPAEGHAIGTNFFGSHDELGFLVEDPQEFDPEAREDFRNVTRFTRFTVFWEAKLGAGVTQRLEVGPAIDHIAVQAGADLGFEVDYVGAAIRSDWKVELDEALELTFGLDAIGGHVTYTSGLPQLPVQGQLFMPVAGANLVRDEERYVWIQPGLWAEALVKPWEGSRIVPGVRLDADQLMGDAWGDARLAAFQAITERTTAKAAVGLYHQPPQIGQLSPALGNPDLRPERAMQYMIGAEQELFEHVSLDLQLYWKELDRLATFTTKTREVDGVQVPLHLASDGVGRSYGGELLLRWKDDERFFAWIAYTLSKSERTNLGSGALAPFALDQPHNLTLVASWRFIESGWQLGGRLRYASGNPFTPFPARVYDVDGDRYMPLQGEPFSERNPDFFQLDVRLDRHFEFEEWRLSTYLDVQNVTNASNAEAQRWNYDFTDRVALSSLPILPSLGVRAEY